MNPPPDTSEFDPLPSWADGPSKQALVAYVAAVTQLQSDDFVPVPARVAVFDNDGTLWPEAPIPIQAAFAVDCLRRKGEVDPAVLAHPMVQATFRGDIDALTANGYQGLLEIVAMTHAGMTTEEFAQEVDQWIRTARHPRWDRPYDECIYQPMREVLAYLRSHDFKTFIVSGGGQDFMRVFAERVYGIPPEQVVGSRGKVKYELAGETPTLLKTLESVFVDDKEGKPVGIHEFIGRRPVLAFGNSDGDKAMLEYTTLGNRYRSLGFIVRHTDEEREFAYDAHPPATGTLVNALAEAPTRGWKIVDMAAEWTTVLDDDTVTAIDVLLEPDGVMLERAAKVNRQLLGVYPGGFALDESHRPHITLLQQYVRTDLLDEVYGAVEAVLRRSDLQAMRLEATGQYYMPDGETGLAGIVVGRTPALDRLQEEIIDAVRPFSTPTGSSSAFVRTPDDLFMNPLLLSYVEHFEDQSAGAHFNPHVTTGVGPADHLDAMVDGPFSTFTFGVDGAAVYQLGQYGTAARRLRTLRTEATQ